MGEDLLDVVEEFRLKGMVCGAINAPFITMIPKKDKLETYQDFKLIAICNLVYKLIIKIAAIIIKPVLLKFMSNEQFGFLDNREIMEVIRVAQEGLHNIKLKKMKSLVLKLDLIKAYDRVNWDFLRLVLLQIKLNLEVTNWIMGCITSANFEVLANGEPIKFFRSSSMAKVSHTNNQNGSYTQLTNEIIGAKWQEPAVTKNRTKLT